MHRRRGCIASGGEKTTSTVQIRLDSKTETEMEEVCHELEMSMNTAFAIYAEKVACEHRIPFEMMADPFYSDENLMFPRQAKAALDAGHSSVFGAARDNSVG
ncbi:MAG: type II toxin-antitoxin system RelB/DinJ family antitoxin [Olsenella sp.]|nr:type II toxin-antitoxin system RelB/DinJ family antitoxin [Atopobiaceae bacterium]MDY5004435.1 type II toxin-antitoxin system RelB/DinJ family antitoxin [Atopobiaceae bacterium]